jgi:hypothetical protein
MDAFARLEHLIRVSIMMLLGLDSVGARPIFATLMTKQSIEVLEAAAKLMLNEKDAERVKGLCAKLGRRNMKRNHIIHGYWTIYITPKPEGQTEEWIRVYDHVDAALTGLRDDDPKLMGVYRFTIPELDKVTGYVEETVTELSVLVADIPKLLAQRQTPEERFRSWIEDRRKATSVTILNLAQYLRR